MHIHQTWIQASSCFDGLIGATQSFQRDGLIRDAIEWTITDMEGVPTSRKDADRQLTTLLSRDTNALPANSHGWSQGDRNYENYESHSCVEMFAHREIEIISRESKRKRNDLTKKNKETSVILESNWSTWMLISSQKKIDHISFATTHFRRSLWR